MEEGAGAACAGQKAIQEPNATVQKEETINLETTTRKKETTIPDPKIRKQKIAVQGKVPEPTIQKQETTVPDSTIQKQETTIPEPTIRKRSLITRSFKSGEGYYPGTKAVLEALEIRVKTQDADDVVNKHTKDSNSPSSHRHEYDMCPEADEKPRGYPDDERKPPKQKWRERLMQDLKYRGKILKSLCVFWAFAVLGWTIGQFGPSFLDLQIITGSTLEQGSAFMTSNSIGYLIGSLSSGLLFDRIKKVLLVSNPMLLLAAVVTIIPWCFSFEVMVIMHLIKGFCLGSIDAVSNALTVYIWGDEGRSFMQTLHFFFAMGGIISPLATAPFLVHLREREYLARKNQTLLTSQNLYVNDTLWETTNISSTGQELFPLINRNSTLSGTNLSKTLKTTTDDKRKATLTFPWFAKRSIKDNKMSSSTRFSLNSTFGLDSRNTTIVPTQSAKRIAHKIQKKTFLEEQQQLSRLYLAYLLTTILSLAAAAPFVFMYCKGIRIEMADCRREEDEVLRVLPLSTKVMILMNMSLLLGTYSAIEDTFAGFLTAFCVRQMDWTKAAGSYATAVYWTAFGSGRFAGIFLVKFCSPVRMLTLHMSLLILAFTGLYFSSSAGFDRGIWLCALLSGFALSVVFPTIFTWTEASLLPVDGKIASIFLVASSSGTMINPIVLGHLMEERSPIWFCYLLLIESFTMLALFLCALQMSQYINRLTMEAPGARTNRTLGMCFDIDSYADVIESKDLLEDHKREEVEQDVPVLEEFWIPDKFRAHFI